MRHFWQVGNRKQYLKLPETAVYLLFAYLKEYAFHNYKPSYHEEKNMDLSIIVIKYTYLLIDYTLQ
jgi:hypothetical protein